MEPQVGHLCFCSFPSVLEVASLRRFDRKSLFLLPQPMAVLCADVDSGI
jgi:hypothetical protein